MPASGFLSGVGAAETLGGVASMAVVNVLQGNNPLSSFAGLSSLLGKYRPVTWANGVSQYSVVVPASTTSASDPTTGNITMNTVGSTSYVFDAIWRASHKLSLNLTKKPVQSGFNISDNAVQLQPRIVLEIGMNDTMDSFSSGMWTGNASKSISAFLTMEKLLTNRVFLTLNTRIKSYTNCMLIDIAIEEDKKTNKGLRAVLTFEVVFLSTVASQTVSARPQATDSTPLGTVQPTNPTSSEINNFQLPSPYQSGTTTSGLSTQFSNVPNAGTWSSNPTGTIAGTLGGGNG